MRVFDESNPPPDNTSGDDDANADNRHLTIQEQFRISTKNNKELIDCYDVLNKYNGINTPDITYKSCVMHGPMVKKVEKEKLF